VSEFPYADQFDIHRTLPEEGTDRNTILATLETSVRARCTAAITTTMTS
jgi:hypothetical protein